MLAGRIQIYYCVKIASRLHIKTTIVILSQKGGMPQIKSTIVVPQKIASRSHIKSTIVHIKMNVV